MDDGGEALVSFVGSHSDTLEFLELAEEVLNQMPLLVAFGIERDRGVVHRGCCEMTILAPRSLSSAICVCYRRPCRRSNRRRQGRPISGATPTVSKRWPGRRTKRTRLPSASVSGQSEVGSTPTAAGGRTWASIIVNGRKCDHARRDLSPRARPRSRAPTTRSGSCGPPPPAWAMRWSRSIAPTGSVGPMTGTSDRRSTGCTDPEVAPQARVDGLEPNT